MRRVFQSLLLVLVMRTRAFTSWLSHPTATTLRVAKVWSPFVTSSSILPSSSSTTRSRSAYPFTTKPPSFSRKRPLVAASASTKSTEVASGSEEESTEVEGPSADETERLELDQKKLVEMEEELYQLAGKKFKITSYVEVSRVLFEDMKLPVPAEKADARGYYSTSNAILQNLATMGYELPRRLLDYRALLYSIRTRLTKRTNKGARAGGKGGRASRGDKKSLKQFAQLSEEVGDFDRARSMAGVDFQQVMARVQRLKEENTLKTLCLVDASGFLFRAYHALPELTTPDGAPIQAVLGFCNLINKFMVPQALKRGSTGFKVVVAFDSTAKSIRNQIFPDYKANRPPCPPPLASQFPLAKEACMAFGIPLMEVPGWEADDVIASFTAATLRSCPDAKVVILGDDKDLMQLVTDRVTLHDPIKGTTIGVEQVVEKFGVHPSQMVDFQALVGDASDNVPGVAGVGQKTAAQLLSQFGNLEEILANVEEVEPVKKREALKANVETVKLSRKLVQLCSALRVPDPAEVPPMQLNERAIMSFLAQCGMEELSRRVKTKLVGAGGVWDADLGPLDMSASATVWMESASATEWTTESPLPPLSSSSSSSSSEEALPPQQGSVVGKGTSSSGSREVVASSTTPATARV